MIKVGVTGGIGSGKSLICRVFAKLGIPVYNADASARRLMETDPPLRSRIISLLGKEVYQGNSLNRSKMAGLIFKDRDLLAHVNNIVHPRVAEDFRTWCGSVGNPPYVIHESAILFESALYRIFDYIVLVTAPEEVRFRRVITRKGMTGEIFQSIMKNQLQEKENILRSHLVLNNDGNNLILPLILKFHTELLQIR